MKCHFFVPMGCWFITFENVNYRTTCEGKILFYYTNLQSCHECLRKCMGKAAMKNTQVYGWHKRFLNDYTSVNDDPR
jgi:hypothetical protein